MVTANYPARARGVGKLMGIVEVRGAVSGSSLSCRAYQHMHESVVDVEHARSGERAKWLRA